jgi:hypothetical protein
LVSPGGWLVSNVLFFSLLDGLKLWGEVALPDHGGWSGILISSSDNCVTFQLRLLGQILLQVWQFYFECCTQVQEISSVVHWLSCSGGGFSLCSFTRISMLGAYFFAPPNFYGSGSVSHQLSHYCQCVMMVHCLFFNFVGQSDFGCCSLAQEMSSMIHYLPCFREWLITHPLSPSCLSSSCLRIVHADINSLLLLLWCTCSVPVSLLLC